MSISQNQELIANMAWCAVIALQIAHRDGLAYSDAARHEFLTQWLAHASLEERFDAAVEEEIFWLLRQSWSLGLEADLYKKLIYLWHVKTGQLNPNSDLGNLTQAVNFAIGKKWHYRLVSYSEWNTKSVSGDRKNVLYISRKSLDEAFDEAGNQLRPVQARIYGSHSSLHSFLSDYGWIVIKDKTGEIAQLCSKRFMAMGH